MLRSLLPVGVLEAGKAVAAVRSVGGRLTWFPKMYSLVKYARLDLLPPGAELSRGLIVDIGANRGDWSAAMLRFLPKVSFVAIEPDPRPYQNLARRFARESNMVVINAAIGPSRGSAKFFMTAHDHASSLLPPLEETGDRYPVPGDWRIVDTIDVEVRTLDELLKSQAPSLVKIDVQGGELGVLRGAREVLAETSFVLIEAVVDHHYKDDAVFADLDAELRSLGFRLQGISEPFRDASGSIVWFDACYALRNPQNVIEEIS